MLLNIEQISQPYSGEYEEIIFDIESNWNSSDWSWIRFEEDTTIWCGEFRGKYIGATFSVPKGIIVVVTTDYIYVIVRMLDLELDTIDAVAVSGGPGSFTGLRIGSATAKGLGLALKKPLIHVPTLDAMAYNLWGSDALICPIMDARRNQVYTGVYQVKSSLTVVKPQCAMDMGELIGELNENNQPVIFLGDGVPVFKNLIEEKMTAPFLFAPPQMNRQRAASVAALGAIYMKEGKTEDARDHAPDYLRKSQAEREREGKELLAGDGGAQPCQFNRLEEGR